MSKGDEGSLDLRALIDPTHRAHTLTFVETMARAADGVWSDVRPVLLAASDAAWGSQLIQLIDDDCALRRSMMNDRRFVWAYCQRRGDPGSWLQSLALSFRRPDSSRPEIASPDVAAGYPLGRFLRDPLVYLNRRDSRAAFADSWDEAGRLLSLCHEGFAAAVANQVKVVVPIVNPRRGGPWNLTSPLLPGVMLLGRRPPELLMESVVHEVGHNRMNMLLRAERLVGDDAAVGHSPFVGKSRPIVALLHGAFSFAQEVLLHRHRIASARHARNRYIHRQRLAVESALTTCRMSGVLTAAGVSLTDAIEDAMALP